MPVPGPPSFFADGMIALPPPTAARSGAELGMQQRRSVLVFPLLADDGRLAVGLRGGAERLRRLLREQRAQLLAGIDEWRQIVHEAPGERVLEHDHRGGLAHRALGLAAAVAQDLFDHRDHLADLHHVSVSSRAAARTSSGGALRSRSDAKYD